MRKTPPVSLLLLVIGVPALFVLMMLWPQIQNHIHNVAEKNDNRQPNEPDVDSSVKNKVVDEQFEIARSVPVEPIRSNTQPSLVEKAVAENREKLQAAKNSYERIVESTDSELLQKYGLEQWRRVQSLVALANQLPQPLAASAKYKEAEALLRNLKADLPNRQLLTKLTELQAQGEQLSFLTKLSEVSSSQPTMREQLVPFWRNVLSWDTQKWLAIIRRESEDLSPDDGGFSDVYNALADFHRKSGSEQAAHDAEQTAWDNALRMTNPTRAAQSGIRSLQRLPASTPSSTRASRVKEVNTIVREVADTHDRMALLGELAIVEAVAHPKHPR